MIKRTVICLLIVLGALLVAFAAFCLLKSERTLSFVPKTEITANYNNYVYANSLDYYSNVFAWKRGGLLGSELITVDGSGNDSRTRIGADRFQCIGEKTVRLNNGILVANGGERIASEVDSFVAFDCGMLYLKQTDSDDSVLYWYDTTDKSHTEVMQDVLAYCVDEGRIVILQNDGWLSVCSEDSVERTVRIEVPYLPFRFMLFQDCAVYPEKNDIFLVNILTGEKKTVAFTERIYANDRLVYICDDEQIFVSFGATNTNGSIVSSVDDPANGLWKIDPVTFAAEKVSERFFDELYLFGGELFGISGDNVYQISASSKEIKMITE